MKYALYPVLPRGGTAASRLQLWDYSRFGKGESVQCSSVTYFGELSVNTGEGG